MRLSGVLQWASVHGRLKGKRGLDAGGIADLYTRTGGTIPTDHHAQRSRDDDQATGRTTGAWYIV